MKKLIVFVVFLFIGGFAFYFLRGKDVKNAVTDFASQRIYIQRDQNISFIPDWTTEEVLLKINTAREAGGLSKLKGSTKLDQSAKARLAVILIEEDVDGSVTGITREKALGNAGYDANLMGDLVLVSFFKSNDPISFWNNNDINKKTLNHPDFKDVGIAIKNSADKVDVYILLASPRKVTKQTAVAPKVTWGGVELWEAINKRRVEMGVNPLRRIDSLCTIASIRLNQLLELGKLDGHAGFVPVLQREDLKWISEKYNISEYLIQGYPTAAEAIKAWENTLGHKSLLAGGEYVFGCVYAQNTFGVAIAAY